MQFMAGDEFVSVHRVVQSSGPRLIGVVGRNIDARYMRHV